MIVIIYLDDLLIVSGSRRKSQRDIEVVLNIFICLGFLINQGKSALEPQQRFLYLGLWWDLVNWSISLASYRLRDLREAARTVIQRRQNTCRKLATLVGRVQSTAPAVPLVRAKIRITQREAIRACRGDKWNKKFVLSEEARHELQFCENLPEEASLSISLPPASQEIDTDASDNKMGWYFNGQHFSE